MKSLFLIVIAAAAIFFYIVWHRVFHTRRVVMVSGDRQEKLQQMLNNKRGDGAKKSLGIKKFFRKKIRGIYVIYYGRNGKEFTRNLLIPIIITVGIEVANIFFLSLPHHWIIPASLFACYSFYTKMLAGRRKKVFSLEFSEALITFNGAISSGRTFLQAMNDFSITGKGAMASEFGMISRRLNMGEVPEQVFMESWKRYPYREYYFFIVAVLLNINSGGRLKEVLAKLQKTIGNNIAMESKMMSMTSEMRTASKITGAIPVVFLLLLKFISPENFEFIMETDSGRVLLYYLIGSEAFGMLVIKFLMRGI